MRTTLSLEDEAMQAIRDYARNRHVSFGRAASDLVLRGARYRLAIGRVNGVPVFETPEDFPVIATENVKELIEEE